MSEPESISEISGSLFCFTGQDGYPAPPLACRWRTARRPFMIRPIAGAIVVIIVVIMVASVVFVIIMVSLPIGMIIVRRMMIG